jgi:hypothetical protein
MLQKLQGIPQHVWYLSKSIKKLHKTVQNTNLPFNEKTSRLDKDLRQRIYPEFD